MPLSDYVSSTTGAADGFTGRRYLGLRVGSRVSDRKAIYAVRKCPEPATAGGRHLALPAGTRSGTPVVAHPNATAVAGARHLGLLVGARSGVSVEAVDPCLPPVTTTCTTLCPGGLPVAYHLTLHFPGCADPDLSLLDGLAARTAGNFSPGFFGSWNASGIGYCFAFGVKRFSLQISLICQSPAPKLSNGASLIRNNDGVCSGVQYQIGFNTPGGTTFNEPLTPTSFDCTTRQVAFTGLRAKKYDASGNFLADLCDAELDFDP